MTTKSTKLRTVLVFGESANNRRALISLCRYILKDKSDIRFEERQKPVLQRKRL